LSPLRSDGSHGSLAGRPEHVNGGKGHTNESENDSSQPRDLQKKAE
jgi:hypothetical protein